MYIYTFYIHYIWTIAYVPPHLNAGPAWAIQVKQCSNIREYKGTLDLGQMCSIWEAVTTYDHIVGPTKTFALRWNLYILHVVVLQISGYIACFKNNKKASLLMITIFYEIIMSWRPLRHYIRVMKTKEAWPDQQKDPHFGWQTWTNDKVTLQLRRAIAFKDRWMKLVWRRSSLWTNKKTY